MGFTENNMIWFRLLFVIVVVTGRTVRFSNVPPAASRTTRTYEIEVPGKPPIRIIEAEPLWDNNYVPIGRYSYRDSLEHRAVKIKSEEIGTTEIPSILEENSTKIYSPEALNTFLKNYAEKIREKEKEIESSEKHLSEEQIDRLSDIGIEEDNDEFEDKSKRWGLADARKPNHPYEDKNGWVTMEAVPWSSSKIQKWHTNQKYEVKPNEYRPYGSHSYSSQNVNSHDYPTNEYNDFKNSYNKPHSSYDVSTRPPFHLKPDSRPSTPTYGYDPVPIHIKPRPDYHSDHSRPSSWEHPSSSFNLHLSSRPESWQSNKKPDVTIYYEGHPIDEHRDIITDGKPGDFPNRNSPYRHPYEPLKERPIPHPSTHPANGNGEWILLSTTKGYQYPRVKQQRSLDFNPRVPNTLGTKRTVRLTVLPPDENSKVNMTTSHGGLLEVESTFETVEQSQRKVLSERLQMNNTSKPILKVKKKPSKQHIIKSGSSPLPDVQQLQLQKNSVVNSRTHNHHDTPAVLAAIGAGMVPATMAMLMPLMNGRRKRNVQSSYNKHVINVTRVPFLDYELTLQRSY